MAHPNDQDASYSITVYFRAVSGIGHRQERGVVDRPLIELRRQVRIAEGRDPEMSAGTTDSQSVRTATAHRVVRPDAQQKVRT